MRHLLVHPLTCEEHDPDIFRLIRRHEAAVDRWFTQRLGYRLHLDSDTARLYKGTHVPIGRPLRAAGQSRRPLRQREYTLAALVFAATASGAPVVSLRDLVTQVRSAAAEAEIELQGDAAELRALVGALRWLIAHGLASEMHNNIDEYSSDENADAILRIRADRIALLPLPGFAAVETVQDLVDEAESRGSDRQRTRARLFEDPVLYRDHCDPQDWAELRRRLGGEAEMLDEMAGLVLEARAEGVAAIDPAGTLSDQRFPTGGTVGHASLLLIDALASVEPASEIASVEIASVELASEEPASKEPTSALSTPLHPLSEVVTVMERLAEANESRWKADLAESPERLTAQVIDYLSGMFLVEPLDVPGKGEHVRLRPAAFRYAADPQSVPEPVPTLW